MYYSNNMIKIKHKMVTYRDDFDTFEKIEALAKKQRCSVSDLLRKFAREGIKRASRKRPK